MKRLAMYSLFILGGLILMTHPNQMEASAVIRRGDFNDGPEDEILIKVNRQYILDLITNLEQDLMARRENFESQKRGFDFGLSRGYSGAEVAKHKLGLAAASNPWGPGRKKRSPETLLPAI